jgi:hypothetical protein
MSLVSVLGSNDVGQVAGPPGKCEVVGVVPPGAGRDPCWDSHEPGCPWQEEVHAYSLVVPRFNT